MPLAIRPIDAQAHRDFVVQRSGSFLQTPSWAAVKSEWASESLGWFDGDDLVGTALVLLRQTPKVKRYLAYLPEGPVIDWQAHDVPAVTEPLLAYLRGRHVFTVKMGPQVTVRRWSAGVVKDAIASGTAKRLRDIPPSSEDATALALVQQLRASGWERTEDDGSSSGFGDFQPRYVFQVPLAGRSRTTCSPASTSCGGATSRRPRRPGSWSSRATTPTSPRSTSSTSRPPSATASRRAPLHYFQRMWTAMRDEDPDRLRLYLARLDGVALAATLWVRVGTHVWYSYGASSHPGARASAGATPSSGR